MRIRCLGYLDAELDDLDQLPSLMGDVESGAIERPEIEIVDGEGESCLVLLCALFRRGSVCVGWLATTLDPGTNSRWVYAASEGAATGSFHEVLVCGAPERVDPTAILNASQVVSLIERIAERNDPTPLVRKRLLELMAPA